MRPGDFSRGIWARRKADPRAGAIKVSVSPWLEGYQTLCLSFSVIFAFEFLILIAFRILIIEVRDKIG